jgi:hypothetical protein
MAKKKETAVHKRLGEELVSLIPSLDEEGLAFLIEQARVHLYNMEVERLEEKAEAAEAASEQARAIGKKGARASGGAKGKTGTAGKDSASPGTGDFRVERSGSGSSYHIISGGKWKMFNEEEMLSIVKICQSKDPILEVTERLCRWFETERPDTFQDLELGDHHDPRMKALVQFLRKKFAVRK